MSESLQKLTHTLAALGELGQEIAETNDFGEMARSTLQAVIGALAIRRGSVAEYDSNSSRIYIIAARGIKTQSASGGDGASRQSLKLNRATVGALIENHSADEEAAHHNSETESLLNALGCELLAPLVVRGELVGMMFLGGKATGEDFTRAERETVRTMARHLAIGMHNHRLLREVAARAAENLRLYEELREVYHDTVRAFAAAIDCKDAYTQGHSERVGRYCAVIARELGWSEEQIEGLTVAGYLHDVGKLTVDRNILNAPHRLDDRQFAELKRHPIAGYEILSRIRHPYADIPQVVRAHHERLDGRGYPDGLTAEFIPLGAKIISLADSWDSMTTDRPYRRRLACAEAVAELRAHVGTQFDAEVLRAFSRAWLRELNNETRDRTFLRLLGKDYVSPEFVRPLLESVLAEIKLSVAA